MAPDPSGGRVDLGPSAHTVADNIKRLRISDGLSLRELADRLAENGHGIAHSGLSKIENKTRRVDVDDLMALAIALGVTPLSLLLPDAPDPRLHADLTGWGPHSAVEVWRWATAGIPLDLNGSVEDMEDAVRYSVSASLPWWLRVETRTTLDEVAQATPATQKLQDGEMAGVNQAALEHPLREASRRRSGDGVG